MTPLASCSFDFLLSETRLAKRGTSHDPILYSNRNGPVNLTRYKACGSGQTLWRDLYLAEGPSLAKSNRCFYKLPLKPLGGDRDTTCDLPNNYSPSVYSPKKSNLRVVDWCVS